MQKQQITGMGAVAIVLIIGLYFFAGKLYPHTYNRRATVFSDVLQNPQQKNSQLNSSAVAAPTCDESLWEHTWHPLDIVQRCIKITGRVQSTKTSDDGDLVVQLAPDSQYVSLPNGENEDGNIVVEAICENKPVKKKRICSGYVSHLTLPNLGDHIAVTGAYVRDPNHGWMEIHPVTKIIIIP